MIGSKSFLTRKLVLGLTDPDAYRRRPAWTDRILYIASPLCDVVQHSYTSYPQITMSDHRPVAADFSIHVSFFNSAQQGQQLTQPSE